MLKPHFGAFQDLKSVQQWGKFSKARRIFRGIQLMVKRSLSRLTFVQFACAPYKAMTLLRCQQMVRCDTRDKMRCKFHNLSLQLTSTTTSAVRDVNDIVLAILELLKCALIFLRDECPCRDHELCLWAEYRYVSMVQCDTHDVWTNSC